MTRKQATNVSGAVLCTLLTLCMATSLAQEKYPSQPVRLIVPNPPGGSTDILARILANELGKTLGQPVVVDYRPGASGTIGSATVANSKPDGHTLLMGHVASHATSPSLYKQLPYDPVKDFAPVTLVATLPNVAVVSSKVPVNSIQELIALARTKPGTLTFGSAGTGTLPHLSGELLKQMAGVDMRHIPYKGSAPALTDLIGGHISLMFENLPGAMGPVKAGQLRALAVTSLERSPAAPHIPTMSEAGLPGFEAVSWLGILAPAGTPKEVIDKLNGEIVSVIKSAEARKQMKELGFEPVGSTPEEFGNLIRSEIKKWGQTIRSAGVQPN